MKQKKDLVFQFFDIEILINNLLNTKIIKYYKYK